MTFLADNQCAAGAWAAYRTVKCAADGADVLLRTESAAGLARIDTLLFDLDGVILDPTASILSAHPIAMQLWAEKIRGLVNCGNLVGPEDVAEIKLAGGFNDDWNIARAVGLFYSVKAEWFGLKDGRELSAANPTLAEAARGTNMHGGGVDGMRAWLQSVAPEGAFREGSRLCDCDLCAQVFMEVVAGPAECMEMYGFQARYSTGPGLIHKDGLLITREELQLPWTLGVYTGRTLGETKVGMRLTGLEGWVPDDHVITVADGMPKPDGRPLRILTQRFGSRSAAFVGDNRDDMGSVMLCRRDVDIPVYSVQLCFGPTPEESRDVFVEGGADLIAPDLRAALAVLKMLREEAQ